MILSNFTTFEASRYALLIGNDQHRTLVVRRRAKAGVLFPKTTSLMSNLSSDDLAPLARFISETYGGDLGALTRYLDFAVLLLHYVPEGEFTEREVQNTGFTLWNLREALLRSDSGVQLSS